MSDAKRQEQWSDKITAGKAGARPVIYSGNIIDELVEDSPSLRAIFPDWNAFKATGNYGDYGAFTQMCGVVAAAELGELVGIGPKTTPQGLPDGLHGPKSRSTTCSPVMQSRTPVLHPPTEKMSLSTRWRSFPMFAGRICWIRMAASPVPCWMRSGNYTRRRTSWGNRPASGV